MSGWLAAEDWKWVQDNVPVLCVDVAPLRLNAARQIERIGLIFRDTPHQGRRWCLVGGRVFREETVAEALARQLRETLGPTIRFDVKPDEPSLYVSQYFKRPRAVGLLDPRQHAVAMNFCVPVEGDVSPRGEALDFTWFAPDELPAATEFGFGQEKVLEICLEKWKCR